MILALVTLMTVLNNGPCLDSPKGVPQTLAADPTAAIVRIEKILSTASMIDGETIGYLYTTSDGTTWLGQRKQQYMSAADRTAINALFASTHLPGAKVTRFPPVRLYGVPTKYEEIFQVRLPQSAWEPLHIQLIPCVAWPSGRALPTPLP